MMLWTGYRQILDRLEIFGVWAVERRAGALDFAGAKPLSAGKKKPRQSTGLRYERGSSKGYCPSQG
ncbi:hypothetical protein, partial [Pseudomonas sp. 43(2021)]|uniref:hypothetical protein n=1 Tax=Pseudomonas sp. 43(2021) TaxID=2813560 RepID=UPI001A9FD724